MLTAPEDFQYPLRMSDRSRSGGCAWYGGQVGDRSRASDCLRQLIVTLLAMVLVSVGFQAECAAQARNRNVRSMFARPDTTRFYVDRNGVPDWETDPDFPTDVFTFVRIRYNAFNGGRGKWATDYPDSDLNMSFRLQQLTSLKVNPDPVVLELTDTRLFDYPFVYFCEPGGGNGRGGWGGGGLELTPEEVLAFRRYLHNGGFAMFDDFWGETEWANFYLEIKKVFPDREPEDIPIEHPVFNCVYQLKEKPQVPSINVAIQGQPYGITWEREDAREVHYRGIFDDQRRLMVMICHNTDLGDGWEREGESEWYFHEFSEKKAYPLGINIIFYAMTH